MYLDIEQAQKILESYQVMEEIRGLEELVNIDYIQQEVRVVKYYSRIRTAGEAYILKLSHLPMCKDLVLEKQAVLSQRYREEGIATPKCYVCNGKYGSLHVVDGTEMFVLLEEDAGMPLEVFSQETVCQVAAILGKIHAISWENKWIFRKGSLYREVESGNTEYLRLWQKSGTDRLPQELLQLFLEKYEKHIKQMKQQWKELPIATVQGDLYWMNLMKKGDKLMVIDYDRAGDEVLLSDLLSVWFRLIFDPVVNQKFVGEKNMDTLWNDFLCAYEKERPLLACEKEALEHQYFVFGAVYGSRPLIDYASQGKWKEAAEGLEALLYMLG